MADLFALSIRQPWVDLILRGIKRIEVREWQIFQRGLFLIHSARTVDWRSAELFGYEDILVLPRGGLVGCAEITDCVRLPTDRWLEHVDLHRVIHPRRPRQFGAVLANPFSFERIIRCSGRSRFFPISAELQEKVDEQLRRRGNTVAGQNPVGPA